MHIPDPIEIMEASAERWLVENTEGDHFRCDCGRLCLIGDGIVMSPNPYVPPVCPDCAGAETRT